MLLTRKHKNIIEIADLHGHDNGCITLPRVECGMPWEFGGKKFLSAKELMDQDDDDDDGGPP
eukprot:scaffold818_cov136-Cylindrotheca_fusiformis.AAC.30